MNKLNLILALALSFVTSAMAQDSLIGKWTITYEEKGLCAKIYYTFDNESEGGIFCQCDISYSNTSDRMDIQGAVQGSMRGTFTCDGNRLKAKWNKKTFEWQYVGEPSGKINGRKNKSMTKNLRKNLAECVKEMLGSEDEYEFRFEDGKLILTTVSPKGETETETWERVE